jgi:hypothetical protein
VRAGGSRRRVTRLTALAATVALLTGGAIASGAGAVASPSPEPAAAAAGQPAAAASPSPEAPQAGAAQTAAAQTAAANQGLPASLDVVMLGNSLTRHGPLDDTNWQVTRGMAASADDKDYVHQVVTQLAEVGVTANPYVDNLFALEQDPAQYQPPAELIALAQNADLLVIQVGDNVHSPHIEDFVAAFPQFLAKVKPLNGQLQCLGRWWETLSAPPAELVEATIKDSCEAAGGQYIKLFDLKSRLAHTPINSPVGDPYWNRSDINNHPSDTGMAAIASRIVSAWRTAVDGPQVGVYYFPGWYDQAPTEPGYGWPGFQWTSQQEPLLGFYNDLDVTVLDQQINWMADAGLDFVLYDWYTAASNSSLEVFRQAPSRQRVDYALLWANHQTGDTDSGIVESVAEWDSLVDRWIDYMADANYLHVDGLPVLYIFNCELLKQSAWALFPTEHPGYSTDQMLDRARQRARAAGLPGIYFVLAVEANQYWMDDFAPKAQVEALSAYNYHAYPNELPFSHSYQELDQAYRNQWRYILNHTTSDQPYFVPLTAGWDKRPWGGSASDPAHDLCTPVDVGEFKAHLEAAYDKLTDWNLTRGIGVIFAWNEFGEGGYIEPTVGRGDAYLAAVRQVFGDGQDQVANGWAYVSGHTYYFEAGARTIGWRQIEGRWYLFDQSGWLVDQTDAPVVGGVVLSGAARVGSVLTVTVTGVVPAGAVVTLTWFRGTSVISGVTGSTYTLTAADAGRDITVKVTATAGGQTSPAKYSNHIEVLGVTSVVLTGTPIPGGTLSVGVVFLPVDGSLTYQWYRGTKVISGVTGRTYQLTAADAGQDVVVKVTVSQGGVAGPVKYSNHVEVLGVSAASLTRVVSGTSAPSLRVAVSYLPADAVVSLLWFRDGVTIPGVTGLTYVPTVSDRGKDVVVKVTVVKAGLGVVVKYTNHLVVP